MCGKLFVTFIENCIRNDYVYLLNGQDEAIEMSRQCNIEVENQCGKNIRSDKNGEYKSHCAEICLESGISIKLLPYSPQSNEKPNVERNDGCIIYKFGFIQILCGGTILTSKGKNKKLSF